MTSVVVPDRLTAALGRLSASLGQLEGIVQRRREAEAAHGDLEAEFLALREDRSRLAVQLDSALARGRALMEANDEVSARLDRATEVVATLLERLDRGDGQGPGLVHESEPPLELLPVRRIAGGGRGE